MFINFSSMSITDLAKIFWRASSIKKASAQKASIMGFVSFGICDSCSATVLSISRFASIPSITYAPLIKYCLAVVASFMSILNVLTILSRVFVTVVALALVPRCVGVGAGGDIPKVQLFHL